MSKALGTGGQNSDPLGVDSTIKSTDPLFYNGMANDTSLKDPGSSTWDVPLKSITVDGVILVAGNTAANVATKLAKVQNQFGLGVGGATATIAVVSNTTSQFDGKTSPEPLRGHEQ